VREQSRSRRPGGRGEDDPAAAPRKPTEGQHRRSGVDHVRKDGHLNPPPEGGPISSCEHRSEAKGQVPTAQGPAQHFGTVTVCLLPDPRACQSRRRQQAPQPDPDPGYGHHPSEPPGPSELRGLRISCAHLTSVAGGRL